MRQLRIAILIASLRGGGAERMALRLLTGLGRTAEVDLIVLDGNRDFELGALESWRPALSARIRHLSQADVQSGTVHKLLRAPRQWWRLQRSLRRDGFDVVLSLMERANLFNLLSLGQQRRVLSVRSHPGRNLADKAPLKRALVAYGYRLLLGRADLVVLNSTESADAFRQLYGYPRRQLRVIYNFCEQASLQEQAAAPLTDEQLGWLAGDSIVICGRLGPEKGQWQLLRAFGRIVAKRPSARLVLIGSGADEQPLRRLTRAMGSEDRVIFAGFQTNPMPWMSRAALVVLPSLWEGFPNTLMEAMALGCPVVACDCTSGPREMLAPGSAPTRKTAVVEETELGVLSPPLRPERLPADVPLREDEAALAEAVLRCLEDRQLARRRGEAAAASIAALSPEAVLPQWQAALAPTRTAVEG